MLLALLAAQAAAVAPPPERFSILVPVAPQRCPPRSVKDEERGGDVVVCATDLPDQTIPLPDEYVYDGPRPSNPGVTGAGALAAAGSPCATSQGGCQVGFGPPIAPIVGALVGLIKDATAKKPDKRGRVPIDISEPVRTKAP